MDFKEARAVIQLITSKKGQVVVEKMMDDPEFKTCANDTGLAQGTASYVFSKMVDHKLCRKESEGPGHRAYFFGTLRLKKIIESIHSL